MANISQTFQMSSLHVPLIDLLLLVPIFGETVPDEMENLCPGHLNDSRVTSLKILIAISAHCDQAHTQSIAFVVPISVNILRGRFDSLLRKAADRREDAVHILTIFFCPWAIQAAAFISLDLCDDNVDQLRRKGECGCVILHWLIVIQKKFRSVRKADGEKVSIGPLAASTARMHHEILDLKEAVQPEIPVGDFLWEESRRIPFTSIRQRGHAAALR